MSTFFVIFAQFAVLAYSFVGGVFLAFSDFIMRSLAMTGGHGGVEAMQAINREVFRWVFMTLFLGMAAGSVVIAAYGAFGLSGVAGTLIMLAGIAYLVGCFGVTVVFNVPMNDALAGMEMSSDTTRDYWRRTYVPRWTFWNNVRVIACAVSAALLLFGILWITQTQSQTV